jgi:hypothetical protein
MAPQAPPPPVSLPTSAEATLSSPTVPIASATTTPAQSFPSIPTPSSPTIPTPSTPTIPTPSTPTIPTPSVPSPATPSETNGHRGLTISTTIGIGVGVAVICVILFTVGFVCVRRRRRLFGLKRKERGERDIEGDTPDEEIAKKLEKGEKAEAGVAEIGGGELKKKHGGAVEAGGSEVERAELGGALDSTEEKRSHMAGAGGVSELPAGTEAGVQELPGQEQAFEMGGGGTFVAELDSKEIERMKSLRATRRVGQDDTAPPLPTQSDAAPAAVPPVPGIVVQEPEGKKL